MGYANIFVSSPCRVSVKNRQLVVRGEEERKFAVEDINSVMLESGECTVSVYALRSLAESGGRKTGGIYPAFVFVKKGKKPRHRQRFSTKNQKNTIQNTAEKQANRGLSPSVCPSLLYHTKTQKGTKTGTFIENVVKILYHTKTQKGTKTAISVRFFLPLLYHTKTQKGTKTICSALLVSFGLYHTKTQKGTKNGGGRRGKEMIASGGRMC